MRRDDPNREYLLLVASAFGDLRNEVVFVGGSVAGLLITDPVAEVSAPLRTLMPSLRLRHWANITRWKNDCRHRASIEMPAAR